MLSEFKSKHSILSFHPSLIDFPEMTNSTLTVFHLIIMVKNTHNTLKHIKWVFSSSSLYNGYKSKFKQWLWLLIIHTVVMKMHQSTLMMKWIDYKQWHQRESLWQWCSGLNLYLPCPWRWPALTGGEWCRASKSCNQINWSYVLYNNIYTCNEITFRCCVGFYIWYGWNITII